jgi:hypothetical protein
MNPAGAKTDAFSSKSDRTLRQPEPRRNHQIGRLRVAAWKAERNHFMLYKRTGFVHSRYVNCYDKPRMEEQLRGTLSLQQVSVSDSFGF